ncbi:MAG: ABC transporter substrate-binding protein [Clostridiales bacterium]|jgi:peptide/nickel transport system substrate-binding protein|nr:ABC transporter substrate-binding protein [Clostridiales bacterium]
MRYSRFIFRRAVALVSIVYTAAALLAFAGCAGLIPPRGGGEAVAEPRLNSGIYSGDYSLDEGPVRGGALRIYATGPDTFNPFLTANVYTRAMLGLVYEGLAKPGPGLAAEFALADSWAPSADGLIWTIGLREGVTWHDGRAFTAYDAVDSADRIRAYGALSPYADMLANISAFEAVSARELRLTLKKPNSFTPYTLIFPIAPAHIPVEALDGLAAGANLAGALVGTGPYRFLRYDGGGGEGGGALTLAVNEVWAAPRGGADSSADISGSSGDSGDSSDSQSPSASPSASPPARPPYVETAQFLFFDPKEAALPRFRDRSVDVFFSRGFDFFRYYGSAEMQMKRYSEREFALIAFNCGGGVTSASVRRAITKLIDREAVVNTALDGRGAAAEFPVQPESWLYGDGFVSTAYDPQSARAILESEGFRLDDGLYYGDVGSGWRRLELNLLVNEADADHVAVAEALARELLLNGLTVNIQKETGESLLQKAAEGAFDMVLLGYRVGPFPDMTELYSEAWFSGGREMNLARYENAEADRLAGELFMENGEPERRAAFSDLTAILQADAPYAGLYFQASSLVYGNDVRGGVYPCAWNPFVGFEGWYLADYR